MPLGPRTAAAGLALSLASPFVISQSQVHGIPPRAVVAYVAAEQAEGCDWRDLAAIGWREAGHGTYGGRHLDEDTGVMTPALIIWDVVDYGGGPMGFLQGTWEGGGYEAAFPGGYQDMDDAARASCRYLQAKGYDRNDPAARWEAFRAYNGAGAYADAALAYADALAPLDPSLEASTAPEAEDQAASLGGTRRRTFGETVEAAWQGAWNWLDSRKAKTGATTPTLDGLEKWAAPGMRTSAPNQRPEAATEAPGRLQAVVDFAVSQVGDAYVWGGEDDTEGGFDCSGLVWAAYMAGGVNLNGGRSTADVQMLHGGSRLAGSPVSWQVDAKAGDLLGFDGGDPPWGHIGLYIGNGEMVDARGVAYGVVRRPVPWDLVKGVTRVVEDGPTPGVDRV